MKLVGFHFLLFVTHTIAINCIFDFESGINLDLEWTTPCDELDLTQQGTWKITDTAQWGGNATGIIGDYGIVSDDGKESCIVSKQMLAIHSSVQILNMHYLAYKSNEDDTLDFRMSLQCTKQIYTWYLNETDSGISQNPKWFEKYIYLVVNTPDDCHIMIKTLRNGFKYLLDSIAIYNSECSHAPFPSTTTESTTEESTVDSTSGETTAAEETTLDLTPTETPTGKTTVDSTSLETPTGEETTLDSTSMETSTTGETSVATSTSDETTLDSTSEETSTVGETSGETPTTEETTVDSTSVETPTGEETTLDSTTVEISTMNETSMETSTQFTTEGTTNELTTLDGEDTTEESQTDQTPPESSEFTTSDQNSVSTFSTFSTENSSSSTTQLPPIAYPPTVYLNVAIILISMVSIIVISVTITFVILCICSV